MGGVRALPQQADARVPQELGKPSDGSRNHSGSCRKVTGHASLGELKPMPPVECKVFPNLLQKPVSVNGEAKVHRLHKLWRTCN